MQSDVPLFPLNAVLFPGLSIRLNIFEKRYLEMIDRCMRNKEQFGIVLIKEGKEALGPLAEPCQVGTLSAIAEHEQLEDGRIMISAVGISRFRIESVAMDWPYLTGTISRLPLQGMPALHQVQRLNKILQEFLDLIQARDIKLSDFPADPAWKIYAALGLINLPLARKQFLLETTELSDLYEETLLALDKQLKLMLLAETAGASNSSLN